MNGQLERDVREIRKDVKDVKQMMNDTRTEVKVNQVKAGFWGSVSSVFTTIGLLVAAKMRGYI